MYHSVEEELDAAWNERVYYSLEEFDEAEIPCNAEWAFILHEELLVQGKDKTIELSYNQHNYDSIEMAWFLHEFLHDYDCLTWEEELILFQQEEDDKLLASVTFPEDNQHLVKHFLYQKKRKHTKDKKGFGHYKCTCTRCQDNKVHRSLRAQKVFLEEEYFDSDSSFWFDTGEFMFEQCDMFPTEDDFLDEIGCEHLCSDFDWKAYVGENGRVLDSWEINKVREYYGRIESEMWDDWNKQAKAATGWDDPNFIEAWDYEDHWMRSKGLL